ncbi:hypothetical protein WICANDRAFT_80161 [Wickerhamomyces anomalus NRRL Y-366-8]|uniref:Chromosome segregation in meiosis protein 3 domain-containing protein n=1 Tax=Wickerhamomyces anomalus (strain ATCC 58044 / CBS 1984 / NCYC 433 / NRRL Y-366-8) TaxID=683960 RepID=A0A1E3NXS6_WICAA|nr:uncharacterized protein WICANDRAFT_80161 [Wickerhamomyces anomalus NRRL Y-366-8]ODQ57999.1 hypothetical protein WICANDRAFT_80161 [Wickerhamomyces anomalus NRRL Y-366-8]
MSQDTSAIDSLLGLNLDQPAADQPLPKPRKRINNLNESHFLGIKGLSYIKKNQKQIRSKLNHKDDYKNLTNLLNFYQLWGHSIYPKANFKDFLDMTVKVGSKSKLLKRQRQDWLNQEMGVEKYSSLKNEGLQQDIDNPQDRDNVNNQGSDDEMNDNNNNDDDDDDQVVKQRSKGNRLFVAEDESDDDDDLYAVPKRRVEKLLSQGDNEEIGKDTIAKENTEDKEEEDKQNKDPHTQKKGLQDFNDDFEDDDDDDFDQILEKPAPPPPTQHQPEEDPDAVMRELQQPQPQDEYDEDEIEYEIMREAGF